MEEKAPSGLPTKKKVWEVEPRLLDVPSAAHYLSVSPWQVRQFVAKGYLHFVQLPCERALLDRMDLDALIALSPRTQSVQRPLTPRGESKCLH